MKKNTAGQKWIVFAFDRTDNTPKTGDAAQITAEVSIDGAAGAPLTDANPTELEDGYYAFDFDADESNGDYLVLMPESSTGDIQVIGVPGGVHTNFPQTVDNNVLAAGVTGFGAINTDVELILADTGTDGVVLAAGAITDASLAGNMEIVFETDFATNYNVTRNAWETNVQDFVDTSAADPFNGQVVAASVTGHTVQTGDTYALASGLTGFDAIDTVVDSILEDTAVIGAAGVGLTGVALADVTSDAVVAHAVWGADATTYQTQGTFGQAIGDPVADTTTIYQAVATDATGDNVAIDVVALKAETVLIVEDTGTTIPGLFTFTVAGNVDANVTYVNDVAVTGTGVLGDEWGP